jgi:outer membrane receptor protein involved in Fe transport
VSIACAASAASTAAIAQLPAPETVVITGEKIARSLMDTASSVEVLRGVDIEQRGLDTTSGLLGQIPNLVVTETSNLAPAVRGLDGTGPAQGADAFFAGTRPRINFQVDGRTLSYNEVVFSDAALWDVDRVEVFRGPQSTLQGRNAIAGAIITRTRDPSYNFGAGGRVLFGDYETRQYSGYVTGPILDDQLAFRLSADVRRSQSYVDFEPFPGIEDPDLYESISLRGKLLFEPAGAPGVSALLTLSHVDHIAPQDLGVARPFEDHVAAFPRMPRFGTRADSAILDAGWEITEGLALRGVFSATDLRVRRWSDPGAGNAVINASEYVAEPRLEFQAFGGMISGFAGVHVFRNTQDEEIDLFGGGGFDDSTDTDAVFGEATWNVVTDVDLTFGGRLEREKRRRTGVIGPFVIDFDETYEVFLPKFVAMWRANPALTVGASVARGYNGGAAGFTYDPPFVSYTYDPEFVWNYEAFVRKSFAEGRGMATLNAFYSSFRDLQLPFDLNPDPAIWSYVIRNADEAESYGAEASLRYTFAELQLFASVGLLQTEVTNYPDSGIEGNEFARSPAFTTAFGANYMHPSGFEVGTDIRFTDTYHTEVVNDPFDKAGSYWAVNARAAYHFRGARVFVTVENIFDTAQPILLSPGATRDEDVANILHPRRFQFGVAFDL